jgi:hypothetical protein
MKAPLLRHAAVLLALACAAQATAQQETQDPQQQIERLRRDQDEILRKRLLEMVDRITFTKPAAPAKK